MKIVKEKNKIAILNEKEEQIAYVTFPMVDSNTVCINHTVVSEEYRGMHLGKTLLENACEVIQANQWKAELECSYAKHWFSKHLEYRDILK